MATVAVIARPGKIVSPTVVVTAHATVQETHTLTNTVTDHPVEQGFNPSDHIRPDPEQVTMEMRISNTPLSSTQATEAVKSGAFTFQTTTALSQAAGAIGAVDGYARKCWDDLKKIRLSGDLVKVVTTLGDYESMAITSITAPRTSKNYDGIAFTIVFKRVRVVQNKLTRDVRGPARVQRKKSAGNQTPKDAESDEDPLITISKKMSSSDNSTVKGLGDFMLSGGSAGPGRVAP